MDIQQQETAIESYSLLRACGNNLVKAILEYLKVARTPKADFEIMEYFDKTRNVVSAARNRLYRDGNVVECGKKRDPGTGRKVIAWKYCPNPVPIEEESAKMILTKIKKVIQETEGKLVGGLGNSHFREGGYLEIKDLVFPKKPIVLPLNKANGTK